MVYDRLMLVLIPSGVHAAKETSGLLDRGLVFGVQDCLPTAGEQMSRMDGVSAAAVGFAAPADSGVPQLTAAETHTARLADLASQYCDDVQTNSLNTEPHVLFPNVPAAARAADALLPLLQSKPDAVAAKNLFGPDTVRGEAHNIVGVLGQSFIHGCPAPGYLERLKAALASAPI
jgi:hypothetical protein